MPCVRVNVTHPGVSDTVETRAGWVPLHVLTFTATAAGLDNPGYLTSACR